MIAKECVETAYCFFHQKQRVYQYSTMEWQKDDIEYAIASYVDGMSAELYDKISGGRKDFLLSHDTFGEDMIRAVALLEEMLAVANE